MMLSFVFRRFGRRNAINRAQFSDTAALFGNDVATFPDYPAEIRAPQGTVGGVSGFQVHIGEEHILLRVIMPMSSWL